MPPELADRAVYWATYWPSFHLAALGFSLRVAGRRHVPAAGPVLLVSNHQSFLDPWLIGQAAPRRLAYLARHTLFKTPAFARLIRAFGAVPIDRGFGKDGLQAVFTQLAAGRAVVVFGEGERSPTGALQPLKAGVGLLLKRAGVPVVPVGVSGAFQAWPRHAPVPTPEPVFGRAGGRGVAVAFGPPIPAGAFAAADRDAGLALVAAGIQSAIAAADRVRRRPPGDTQSSHDTAHPPG